MANPLWRFPPTALAREVLLSTIERAATATLDAVLESPRTERVVDRALDQPGLERLIERVLRSELANRTVDRVLESEELDRIVTYIAESDEVRDAIASQTVGLAGEVGGEVRTRAAGADAIAERLAQRLVGRHGAPEDEATGPGAPAPPSDE